VSPDASTLSEDLGHDQTSQPTTKERATGGKPTIDRDEPTKTFKDLVGLSDPSKLETSSNNIYLGDNRLVM
jgi:hypothetical protein